MSNQPENHEEYVPLIGRGANQGPAATPEVGRAATTAIDLTNSEALHQRYCNTILSIARGRLGRGEAPNQRPCALCDFSDRSLMVQCANANNCDLKFHQRCVQDIYTNETWFCPKCLLKVLPLRRIIPGAAEVAIEATTQNKRGVRRAVARAAHGSAEQQVIHQLDEE